MQHRGVPRAHSHDDVVTFCERNPGTTWLRRTDCTFLDERNPDPAKWCSWKEMTFLTGDPRLRRPMIASRPKLGRRLSRDDAHRCVAASEARLRAALP